jgi:hypothetical protein
MGSMLQELALYVFWIATEHVTGCPAPTAAKMLRVQERR